MQIIHNFQDVLIILLISSGKSSLMVIKPGGLLRKKQIPTPVRDEVLILGTGTGLTHRGSCSLPVFHPLCSVGWDRQPKEAPEHLHEKVLKINWAMKINVEWLLVCRTFYFCFTRRVTLRIFCLRGEVLLIWTPLPGAMCDELDELFFIRIALSFDQFLIHRAVAPKRDGKSVPALRGMTLGTEQTTEQDGERPRVRISVPILSSFPQFYCHPCQQCPHCCS